MAVVTERTANPLTPGIEYRAPQLFNLATFPAWERAFLFLR